MKKVFMSLAVVALMCAAVSCGNKAKKAEVVEEATEAVEAAADTVAAVADSVATEVVEAVDSVVAQ
jgi:hypothetical protein